jgi:hypothetical protein
VGGSARCGVVPGTGPMPDAEVRKVAGDAWEIEEMPVWAEEVRAFLAVKAPPVDLHRVLAAVLVHTGEVELDGDDVRGMAVHVGARVAAQAGPSEVFVSQTGEGSRCRSGRVWPSTTPANTSSRAFQTAGTSTGWWTDRDKTIPRARSCTIGRRLPRRSDSDREGAS